MASLRLAAIARARSASSSPPKRGLSCTNVPFCGAQILLEMPHSSFCPQSLYSYLMPESFSAKPLKNERTQHIPRLHPARRPLYAPQQGTQALKCLNTSLHPFQLTPASKSYKNGLPSPFYYAPEHNHCRIRKRKEKEHQKDAWLSQV